MVRLLAVAVLTMLGVVSFAARSFAEVPIAAVPPAHLVLTKGIVGGIVAPHVSLQIVVVKSDVYVMSQPARNAPRTYKRGVLTAEQFESLFEAAKKLDVWSLPTEKPVGCEDIYQMDTSINIALHAKSWRNGGPAGCVHGKSKVQPTAQEKARFSKLVEAIKSSAKLAVLPCDARTYASALEAAGQKNTQRNPREESSQRDSGQAGSPVAFNVDIQLSAMTRSSAR